LIRLGYSWQKGIAGAGRPDIDPVLWSRTTLLREKANQV
jgi:hypothetical protein